MGNVALEGFGGGSRLNFKIVAGLTQPGSATENTIWVKTEKMTGWIIDANQPEELEEGMVWISVGTKSDVEFNALKKNGIQVYPLSAKQYVDSALVSIKTQIYQNGKWGDPWWNGELYDAGDEYAYVTGGWTIVQSKTGYPIDPNSKKYDNYFRVYVSNSRSASFITQKKVDVSRFTVLKIKASTAIRFGISENPTLPHDFWVASAIAASNGDGVLTLPTTEAKYYIWVGNYASAAEDIQVYKMWLE